MEEKDDGVLGVCVKVEATGTATRFTLGREPLLGIGLRIVDLKRPMALTQFNRPLELRLPHRLPQIILTLRLRIRTPR